MALFSVNWPHSLLHCFTDGFRLKSTNPESITALDVHVHLVIIKALSNRKCGQRKGYVALTGSRWKRWTTKLLCCFYSWTLNVLGVILRESSNKEKSVWGEVRLLRDRFPSFQYCIAHSIEIGPFGVMVNTYLSAPVELKSVVHRCNLACSQVNIGVNYCVFQCHLYSFLCLYLCVFMFYTCCNTKCPLGPTINLNFKLELFCVVLWPFALVLVCPGRSVPWPTTVPG